MKTTCLINNYNYSKYVTEAIESALNQKTAFDEIIVVDDGSTDNSAEIIKARFGTNKKISLISKPNQGQLSSFNTGFNASSGDIIFFLDSDDIFEPDYLHECISYYEHHPKCDFLYTSVTTFGNETRHLRPFTKSKELGFSAIITLFTKKWLGQPTSAISIRRSILQKFLPMPDDCLKNWRVRADDCLVWGASLAGAYKCYCDLPLVLYRIHDNNNFNRKKHDYHTRINRVIAVNSLFEHFENKFKFNNKDDFYKLVKAEFNTIPNPTLKDL